MASSGCSGSLADVLLCAVCCEQIKTPKMIPCGHSFCLEPCLRDLLKKPQPCPLCRHDIQAPPSGLADDFPTNFALHALVSTNVTSTTEESDTLRSGTSDDSKIDCELHQRQGEYFCGTCLKFLCNECNETHEDVHEIEDLNTISERRIGELTPLMGEIGHFLEIIRERMESVKDAKVKCEKSCQQAESEICDAVSSFTNLIQEEGKKLVIEVAKGRESGIKALNKLEVQLSDVEVTAKRTEGKAASLMTRIGRNDIRDTGIFDALTTQQEKMNKELASIPAPTVETFMVKFQSKVPVRSDNSLGEVKVLTRETSKVIQQKGQVNILMKQPNYEAYQGFVWFSLNNFHMVFLNKTKVAFTPFSSNVKTNVSEAEIGINATRVSPVLGKDGRSILINDSKHVVRLTIDLSTAGKASTCKWIIENTMLYNIAAVCWDAKREGCYVLLHDKYTICHFMFEEPDKGCQYIRLNAKITNAVDIHVSEFGGMAICHNYCVRYYAKVQPQVTRVIRYDLPGVMANCLTSRGSDRKWFVNWGNSIIQYSDTFQVEKTFALGYSVVSIHFLDERYVVAATGNMLTVYAIEP